MADIKLFDTVEPIKKDIKINKDMKVGSNVAPDIEKDENEGQASLNRTKLGKRENTEPHSLFIPLFDAYNVEKTKELVEGKPSVATTVMDTAIDTLIPAASGQFVSEILKSLDGYKGAKLRNLANRTSYRTTDPELIDLAEGSIVNPSGVLERELYKSWGQDSIKKAEAYAQNQIEELIHLNKISPQELEDYVKTGNMTKNVRKLHDTIKNEVMSNIPSAQSVLDEHLSLKPVENSPHRNKEVEIRPGDKEILKTPDTTMGALSGAGAVGGFNTLRRKTDEMRMPDKGGVNTYVPTISKILDDTGISYSRQSMIKYIDIIYDDIIANGSADQRKQARMIMAELKGLKSHTKYGLKRSLEAMLNIRKQRG